MRAIARHQCYVCTNCGEQCAPLRAEISHAWGQSAHLALLKYVIVLGKATECLFVLFYSFSFSIEVDIRYYFIFISGVQHSG